MYIMLDVQLAMQYLSQTQVNGAVNMASHQHDSLVLLYFRQYSVILTSNYKVIT